MINANRNSAVGYHVGMRLGAELAGSSISSGWWNIIELPWSFVEGVSIDCDGTDAISITKADFWSTTKTYHMHIIVDVVSGGVIGPYDGTNTPAYGELTASGVYSCDYSPAATSMLFYSNSFEGSITSLSIKEKL